MAQVRYHADPGLQPERTSLAWGRTMFALVTVSLLFLRWLPVYGWLPAVLIVLTLLTAGGVYFSQRSRYVHGGRGIAEGRVRPDIGAVMVTGGAIGVLALLGMVVIIASPLD
ncbi:DUF202 domain-containing protein [Arthrobacter castelli]|uniref:DUF202 domain-containing protein n=1 Tax=Arthrobacter castelli TaxID=271431 RepID=UPI00041ED250